MMASPDITAQPLLAELARSLGLTEQELESIHGVLGRQPNHLELALYAVMWSEHCSYKSSRLHLRRLPTEGPRVLVGPGENAGVIDAGDGIAVALRIESHNHPSAIEPHQGAATGVGGILRDIFTMGARPLAVMDPLFFGTPEHPRQQWLLRGVVSGISSYGNSVGVPTVGGELTFDPCYQQNPLVNVLCLGALPVHRLVRGIASGPGNVAVLLGASTGRDGIGGVSVLASAGFTGDEASGLAPDDDKRPSVQVGDPFEEKRLIEACLALLDQGLVVGIQDLGGAGLICATSETAARAGTGMDVDVTAVPRREPHMEPWEVMTSESQERMLAIVRPDDLSAVEALCKKWEVRTAVVGKVTAAHEDGRGKVRGRLRVLDGFEGEVLADVPAGSLADEAPLYDRPRSAPVRTASPDDDPNQAPPPEDCGADLLRLLVDPSWIYRQYDHQLFLNTVQGPGGDAAVLRLAGPGLPHSERGLALTTDSNPRWCTLDARAGTALVIAEAMLNLSSAGATPVAVVNCLNFGNPEHPEVMWQLSEAIDGLTQACRDLDIPVVGGNVSLYNESAGADIRPTPVIGMLGLIERLRRRPPGLTWASGAELVLVGARSVPEGDFPLGGSRWGVEIADRAGGTLPPINWEQHQETAALVRLLVGTAVGQGSHTGPDLVDAVHDVSEGGLAVALAEMAANSGIGAEIHGLHGGHAELFSELPGRVVIATTNRAALEERADQAGVPTTLLGRVGGQRLVVEGHLDLSVDEIRSAGKTVFYHDVASENPS